MAGPFGAGAKAADRMLPAWLALALAAAAGAGHTVAYVHTLAWPLALAAVGVFAALLRRAPAGRAALIGLVFGTAWLGAATWWLFISMHRYGGLPAWMAAAAVAALSAFLSLYLAAAGAAFARWRSGRPGADALLFAALWLLAELARGVIFTGFPWAASGYAHVDGPLAALAPWIGVYGLGAIGAFLVAWAVFGAWPAAGPGTRRGPTAAGQGDARSTGIAAPGAAAPSARRRRAPAALGLGVLALLTALPVPDFTRPSGPRPLSVALLQGNVPQDEKFETAHQIAAIDWHVKALLAARGPTTDLVIAPETALVLLPEQMPPDFWPSLQDAFSAGRTHALVGVPWGDAAAGYTNTAMGLSPRPAAPAAASAGASAADSSPAGDATLSRRADYRYDKHHLVPFGEFIPAGFRWFTEMMDIPLGDFARGPLVAPSMPVGAERVAPNVCYEDLFGEELAARFADPARAPTIFANISNIGWFGDSIAVDQHLQISRFRTLELQRPMLRATNTGATVAIDHRGRVTARLAPFTRGVLQAQVQGRDGLTPFAAWASRAGLWPLGLLAAAIVGAALWRSRPARAA